MAHRQPYAILRQLKIAAMTLPALVAFGAGAVMIVHQGPRAERETSGVEQPPAEERAEFVNAAATTRQLGEPEEARFDEPEEARSDEPEEAAEEPLRTLQPGNVDALPPGARLRLGSMRFRYAGGAFAVECSPDGKLLAVASYARVVHLCDAADGRELWHFPCDHAAEMAFAPAGRTLAIGSRDAGVRLWDVKGGAPAVLHDLPAQEEGDGCYIAFAPQGDALASAGGSRTINLWDVATGKVRKTLSLPKDVSVRQLAFAPDGKRLASVGHRQSDTDSKAVVLLWDVATGRVAHVLPTRTWIQQWAFSPDGKILAVLDANDQGQARRWDVATGKDLGLEPWDNLTLRSQDRSAALSPEGGKYVAKGIAVRQWEAARQSWKRRLESGHEGALTAIVCSPDGRTVASCDEEDPQVLLWDLATGKILRRLSIDPKRFSGFLSLAFSPRGKFLAAGSKDGLILLADAATGQELRRFRGGDRQVVYSVAFSPDGKTLVSSTSNLGAPPSGTVEAWEVSTGRKLRGEAEVVPCVAFAPDGRTLALARSGLVELRDANVGTTRQELFFPQKPAFFGRCGNEPYSGCRSVTFAPDGKIVAGGNDAGMVRVWNGASGKLLFQLTVNKNVHQGAALAFSPDGKTLVAGGSDGNVRLWEVATGRQRLQMKGHRGPVNTVAVAADGRAVFSGSADSTVLVWDPWSCSRGVPRPPQAEAAPLSAADLAALWVDMADRDAMKAFHAMRTLGASPRQAVDWFRERLRPASVDAQRIARLIRNLDDKEFPVRQQASKELIELGDLATDSLNEALASRPSLEVRVRIEEIMRPLETRQYEPAYLRALRAVEVLERVGAADARQLLERLAQGAPPARLTVEARQALDRLARKAVSLP